MRNHVRADRQKGKKRVADNCLRSALQDRNTRGCKVSHDGCGDVTRVSPRFRCGDIFKSRRTSLYFFPFFFTSLVDAVTDSRLRVSSSCHRVNCTERIDRSPPIIALINDTKLMRHFICVVTKLRIHMILRRKSSV